MASGTIRKQVYNVLGSKIYLVIEWERISYSVDNNTTTIKYTPKIETSLFLDSADVHYSYQFGNSDIYSGTKRVNFGDNSTSFGTVEITSQNNINRDFSQLCKFHVDWIYNKKEYSYDLSEYVTIDPIPSKATITSVDDFNDEEDVTIYYNKPNMVTSTAISAALFSTDGTSLTSYTTLDIYSSSDVIPITYSERVNIRKTILAHSTSTPIIVRLRTAIIDSGVTQYYYSDKTVIISLINYKPVVKPYTDIIDTKDETVALTGNNTKLIRYVSNAYIELDIETYKEATLVSQYITNGNTTINKMTGTFNEVQSNIFYIGATDSRGVTAKNTVIADIIPYVKLTSALRVAAFTLSGDLIFALDGNYYNGSFGAQNNSLEIYFRLKKNGQLLYTRSLDPSTEGTITYNGDTYHYEYTITGLTPVEEDGSYNTYSIEVTISDKLMVLNTTEVYSTAAPVFHWGKNDFEFNVPVHFNRGFTNDAGIKTAYFVRSLSITGAGAYAFCTLDELGISSYTNDIYNISGTITSEDSGKIYAIPSPPLGNATGTYVIGDSTKFYIENDTIYITVGAAWGVASIRLIVMYF